MKTRRLSEVDFQATMTPQMQNVTDSSDEALDIWPYVDSVPASELDSHELGDVAVVYRSADGHFEHVLISTTIRNVFLTIVVDRTQSTIAGHHLLDLNKKYGVRPLELQRNVSADGFICQTCGQFHEGLPMDFGSEAPAAYYSIPPEERAARCELTADLCVIDETEFFVRGCLEIPVVGGEGPFTWGVWTSLSKQSFQRMAELWESPERDGEPPFFGWLCTSLPLYPVTLLLKTHVHTRPLGQRPFVELEANDHPLAIEQRQGITMDRVRQIAEALLHGTEHEK